jgi:predicted transcriptional regulator of viral defense system
MYSLLVLLIALMMNKMRYLAFRDQFKDFTVFSLTDILNVEAGFHRRRLNDWQEKGYLKKVIKGHYIFSDQILHEKILFEIANRIYQPSYISFEMALSYYSLIPESAYGITSATSRPTHSFVTPMTTFSYHTLRSWLFFGYVLMKSDGEKHFSLASPEKAILDLLYLKHVLKTREDFEGLRLNPDIFARKLNQDIFFNYLDRFAQKSLTLRARELWRFMQNA